MYEHFSEAVLKKQTCIRLPSRAMYMSNDGKL